MILSALLLSALTVMPADRMAIADRLFDRGNYTRARVEYKALEGAEGIAPDELLYREAECARALHEGTEARALYGQLLEKYPLMRYAPRARLERALLGTDEEKKAELKLLDADSVPAPIRAVALYHLGVLTNDPDALARSAKLDPQGPCAPYAAFRRAALLAESTDPVLRRQAIGELMGLARGADPALAREAVYLAAMRSYTDKHYAESAILFSRFLKQYPDDARAATARTMSAWSDFLTGKYAECAALCGEGATEDTAYLRAACAHATGDAAAARTLFTKYLETYPQGRYRTACELPLARLDFAEAEKGGDVAKTIEAAERSANLSKSSADRLRLAWAYEKGGRTDEALATYQGVARDFPSTDDAAEALFRKAMIDLRAKRWSPAELSLAEALATEKNPSRKAESLYWRGIAAHELGHVEEGDRHLQAALAAGLSLDQTREAKMLLADDAFKAGRLDEARAAYAALVADGACDRMSAAKIRSVGHFLLEGSGTVGESGGHGVTALPAAKICAKALVDHGETPEWRQSGYALRGAVEEANNEFAAAIASYRAALAEPVRTDDARTASLALGVLESKAGDTAAADKTLKEALKLNAADSARRAEAYLWLAKNCEAAGDAKSACGYATVVVTLFDDAARTEEAKKILSAHPKETK